jgi:hypothetical protein
MAELASAAPTSGGVSPLSIVGIDLHVAFTALLLDTHILITSVAQFACVDSWLSVIRRLVYFIFANRS